MLARHDWVTPVLYGHPWLERPPLYYWCAMIAYKGAGEVSDVAARLPSAVLSMLLTIFIYLVATFPARHAAGCGAHHRIRRHHHRLRAQRFH